MDRLAAHAVIVAAYLVGGGSLLLFGAFLVAKPFPVVRFAVTETQALFWDAFVSLLFFIQHSATVRKPFRAWLASAVPPYVQPAAYAIASGTLLAAVVLSWQSSPTVLLETQGPLRLLLRALQLSAIAGIVWGVCAFDAFDPFGRGPIVARLRGRQPPSTVFVLRGPFLWVRHPLYFFILLLIWSTPDVNADRLLFNLLWTAWIVCGSYLEERDLAAEFGENYRRYQETVPMLLPWRGPAGRKLRRS